MSKGGPHDLGEVSHRNVVPCSSDGIRSNHASVAPAQKERVAVLTDMVCPPPSSTAGALLATVVQMRLEMFEKVSGKYDNLLGKKFDWKRNRMNER